MTFTVVVTRDATRAAPLATALAAHGVDVVAIPCTKVVWADALQVGADYDGVAVASANAAEALRRAGFAGGPVVAVGAATAAVLGCAVEIAGPDSVAVAEALIARGARRVLWPRAAEGREEGIERLRAAGVEVDAPIAYRTEAVALDDAARALLARADVLAIYAPSQVAALGELPAAAIVVIGETTAAAVRARGREVAAVAASPDTEAMASAILAVLSQSS